MDLNETFSTYQVVRDKYSDIARLSINDVANAKIAQAFGYSLEELQSVSSGNLGLGCGAPVGQAKLKQGETVLDLGSGGGLDVFLAAKTASKAIGVDMSQDMIALARRNAAKMSLSNDRVEFVYSKLPQVNLPDNSVDCVLSNCIINLIPHVEKGKVFQEMFRVLKPGGRVAVSDVLARKPLPEEIRNDVAMYVGCVTGASQLTDYQGWLKQAGFQLEYGKTDVAIVDSNHDINLFRDNECCAPSNPQVESGTKCCGDGCRTAGHQGSNSAAGETCCGKKLSDRCCNTNSDADLEMPEGPFSCCSPQKTKNSVQTRPLKDSIVENLNEWVGSFMIFSVKPIV